MVGNAEQFASFRTIFRGHLAGADEKELHVIVERLAALNKDVVLRLSYLRRLHPERIIKGAEEQPSALFFASEGAKGQQKAEIGGV